MIVAALTDTGNVREKNEDYYYISNDNELNLFIVADGMGGHNGGEIASKSAIEAVFDYFKQNYFKLDKNVDSIKTFIIESIEFANKKVFGKSFTDYDLNGMGTTLTLLLIENGYYFIGHIGDSRAYLIRNNNIIQLTEDHSFVEELVKLGKITQEEARTHPQKNIITRALGTDEEIKVDVIYDNIYSGDILFLCTDGLTNMLTDEQILNEFIKNNEINISCANLINLAKFNGGYDNITIVAVKEVA